MRKLTKADRDQLEEAMEMVYQASVLVADAVEGTEHELHYNAYGQYGFATLLGNGNPYDDGIHTLIASAEEEIKMKLRAAHYAVAKQLGGG